MGLLECASGASVWRGYDYYKEKKVAILYPNLAKLSNVSADNPKVRPLRAVTVFNAVFIGVIILLVVVFGQLEKRGVLAELLSRMSDAEINTASKAAMALILAVPMLFFGNIAPQIPFNRYTGLRLPWTVRDEETWIVAHRVLGYISIPAAILIFVNVPTDMSLDAYVKVWWLGALIMWIGIPGLTSGIFYYKKWNGKL